jgi:EAL domain-containing protein (putative c-di-GMP-specific phosphodiesterase class I)
LIANPEETAAALAELRGHGIQIALDDFGAGYASLAYLTQLPLDVLKLDRRFIVGMTSDSGTASIVSSVISIAHGIGLRVVAEGVDNPTQLEMLEDFGCDEVQGFLVSEPMAHDEFRSLLERDEASPGLWILGEK